MTQPQESYDGKTLYFLEREGDSKLEMIMLGPNGTGSESYVAGMPLIASDLGWTVGREGIYFVQTKAPRIVAYFDFATQRSRELFKANKDFGDGLSVSPGGRYLLFSEMDEMNSEIMLVDKFH